MGGRPAARLAGTSAPSAAATCLREGARAVEEEASRRPSELPCEPGEEPALVAGPMPGAPRRRPAAVAARKSGVRTPTRLRSRRCASGRCREAAEADELRLDLVLELVQLGDGPSSRRSPRRRSIPWADPRSSRSAGAHEVRDGRRSVADVRRRTAVCAGAVVVAPARSSSPAKASSHGPRSPRLSGPTRGATGIVSPRDAARSRSVFHFSRASRV